MSSPPPLPFRCRSLLTPPLSPRLTDTVQPPDRVGVVRKLRLGVTLKKEGGSYTLDMTQARYKTSRFYGPSITSMSALLTEPLDAYLAAFQWETHGNETPYLFHPTSDTTRCLPSSQWSAVVKACFKKHSPGHVAPPPKLLRASFITWLRDSTDAPDVLKAAAKAMRHKEGAPTARLEPWPCPIALTSPVLRVNSHAAVRPVRQGLARSTHSGGDGLP